MSGAVEIVRFPVESLLHIEGFSAKRVDWLVHKIRSEGIWSKPLALDNEYGLVMDGQHRMEAAKRMGLKWVPAVRYNYADVEVWSLRPNHSFDWQEVVRRALAGEPYPYKTVKHRFPGGDIPACSFPIDELTQ